MSSPKKLGIFDIYRLAKSVGWKNIIRAIWYAFYRDQKDRVLQKTNKQNFQSPSDIISLTRSQNGARFRFTLGQTRIELEINFLTSDMVQISWGNANPPIACSIEKTDWGSVKLEQKVNEGEYCLSSDALSITIFPDGGIRFTNNTGFTLREEMPPAFSGNRSIHRASLKPGSAIYGLGERATPFNHRHGSFVMWNSEVGGSYSPGNDPLYTCIPVYLEISPNSSYLIFYENPARAIFHFSETAEVNFEAGMLRYYFIYGEPQHLITRYTELTGKPPLPPRWALGYHQSRWGYKTEADIRKIIREFVLHEMPISAIHLDIDYMQDFRVFTVNQGRFPNLEQLSEELAELNIKIVAILDPGVKDDQDYFMCQEGLEKNYFCLDAHAKPVVGVVWPGRAYFPDFTNPEVRNWWSDKYSLLLNQGIDGFWHDMNEPSSFSAWGDRSLPISTQHHLDGKTSNHLFAHNLYGLLMAQAGYEGIKKHQPGKRPWILTRSGWAGYQRYAWIWTGDIETSWDALKSIIPTILGLGLSGQPFSGPDIGGFSGNPSAELFIRWFQLSSFLPFFRTHSSLTSLPREPWTFGEPYTSIARNFLKLRYALLPYWYSLAWQASQTGIPLVRPLFWLDSSSARFLDTADAFLLGDALLVAPILDEGALTRKIVFPPGKWYSFWDDSIYQTDDQITIASPLDQIPLYAKAGKIIPFQEQDNLVFSFYIPEFTFSESEPALTLYTDLGDGYPDSPNDYRIDTFLLEYETADRLVLRRKQRGEFSWPYRSTFLSIHGPVPEQVWVDGKPLINPGAKIETGLFQEIILKLPE